jgi:hypothetical protein
MIKEDVAYELAAVHSRFLIRVSPIETSVALDLDNGHI